MNTRTRTAHCCEPQLATPPTTALACCPALLLMGQLVTASPPLCLSPYDKSRSFSPNAYFSLVPRTPAEARNLKYNPSDEKQSKAEAQEEGPQESQVPAPLIPPRGGSHGQREPLQPPMCDTLHGVLPARKVHLSSVSTVF